MSILTSASSGSLPVKKFHPFAWWGWAIILSIALFISNDPWYATGLVSAGAILVWRLRQEHPWSRSFAVAMRFVAIIITIRMAIAVLIGVPIPGTTLFTLPSLPQPEWIAGIRIGGAVTVERLGTTLAEVMIIVGVIALFAAATTLTSPHRLIRAIPFAFYQLSLILTVATSVFPQLVISIRRIKTARKLRGQEPHGIRHWRKVAMPLLEESLERSLDLAAAMESRGFGQRVRRTSYRPDRWKKDDWLILLSAAFSIAVLIVTDSQIASLLAGVFAGLLAFANPGRAQ